MVWSCIGWNSVGMLTEVVERMNAKQYMDILNDHLLSSMAESGIDEEDIIRAREWFKEHNINVLDWLTQSPDINVIFSVCIC